mgnify:CR=1 FL=1
MANTVRVELGSRSYDVRIGADLLGELGQMAAGLGAANSILVADSNVSNLYGEVAINALTAQGVGARLIDFPAGEANKNLATMARLYDALFEIRPQVDRGWLIVALGGGVAGDMAGFLAATALRGLKWMQCPTTLLADVDASVGGKTGIDHAAGKNLIGAFHQPNAVLIDVDLLKTLSEAELANGLAECVKHAIIRDAGLLDFLEDHIQAIRARQGEVMTELVTRNVQIKAAVVSADEKESGERAHLNFGHTIGHAIETLVGYDKIAHGQAVALGMAAGCRMAAGRGFIEDEAVERVRDLLASFALPVTWKDLDGERIWEIMQHDKKVRDGQVRMVLPVVLGQAAVFDDITPEMVREAVAALRPETATRK